MSQLKKDSTIEVEVYRIDDYKTAARQNEMHHINSDVKTSVSVKQMKFKKGDYYIPMNQEANRFLIETLEPAALTLILPGISLMPFLVKKKVIRVMHLKILQLII
jgi:hypothetical protein